MKTLIYNELEPARIPHFDKILRFLQQDDFRSAQVKKVGDNLYRARLDKSNRLLFSIYQHGGEPYALILEWIEWHAYHKSRFLSRDAVIDEDKIPDVADPEQVEPRPLAYVNPAQSRFHVLDKILSFDRAQTEIYALQPPLIVIGSAGSGKTALTLEKMKRVAGDILYVTRSSYLVHSARQIYYSANYVNEQQNIDFLSFQEYLESIRVPEGHELGYREFATWLGRQRRPRGLEDPFQLFEEFKGVITGPAGDAPWLDRDAYLALGVRQSIFAPQQREAVYEVFEKYLAFMREQQCYDANILSHLYLEQVGPRYDFVVVDEVQDLTAVQLRLVLAALRNRHQFLLCGDSNQIVHPNFFSWSKVKSYFYGQDARGGGREIIRILDANYRNSPEVTEIANRVLKIKNARFGSVDKESNYLVRSNAHNEGVVVLLEDDEAIKREIDRKTHASTRFAVLVMHPEQKAAVKEHFRTPLVFSIQEAKGLEYENVVLFNFVSGDAERFREITHDVRHEDLIGDELRFARARDKGDKSLEIYKFHINALYVALTRAVRNIYLIELATDHRLFDLLGLQVARGGLALEQYGSTLDEWRAEAHRLELQGKQEQAQEIRSAILKQKEVPWTVLRGEALAQLHASAMAGDKKARLRLFEYALVYRDQRRLNALQKAGFGPALHPEKGLKELVRNHYMVFDLKQTAPVLRQTEVHGVDFRNCFDQTPLMIAARLGKADLVAQLIERGADTDLVDAAGLNPFRIALAQAVEDARYCASRLPAIYARLAPDALSVQVEGRLVKLDNRQAEFLLLNLMMVLFYTRLGEKLAYAFYGAGLESADFVEALEAFPEHIVPAYRKKRAYVSSVLAKNTLGREEGGNRMLFLRVSRGKYLINPLIGIRAGGEWVSIYDLLRIELVAPGRIDAAHFHFDPNAWREDSTLRFERMLKGLAEQAREGRIDVGDAIRRSWLDPLENTGADA
jgi:hypothetical protein